MIRSLGLAAGVSLLGAGGALAATRIAKSRCSDAARIINSMGKLSYKGKEIRPDEAKEAAAHLNKIVAAIGAAQAKLKEVPKEDLDLKDPEMKQCAQYLAIAIGYARELKEKLAGAQAGAPLVEEFQPYKASFLRLAAAHFHPSADVFGNLKPEDVRKANEDMAAVAAICAAKLPDAGKTEPVQPERYPPGMQWEGSAGHSVPAIFAKDADNWCWIAKNRDTLTATAAGNKKVNVEGYGNVQFTLPRLIEKFSAENAGMDSWVAKMLMDPTDYFAKLDKAAAATAAGYGGASAEAGHAGVTALLKELQAKVDAAAPSVKFSGGSDHAAAIEKDAAVQLKTIYPEAKVVASGMHSGAWSFNKNALDVPLSRYRSGSLAFSLPGSKWCLERDFSWLETYSGGGNYEPPSMTRIVPGTKFLACP